MYLKPQTKQMKEETISQTVNKIKKMSYLLFSGILIIILIFIVIKTMTSEIPNERYQRLNDKLNKTQKLGINCPLINRELKIYTNKNIITEADAFFFDIYLFKCQYINKKIKDDTNINQY